MNEAVDRAGVIIPPPIAWALAIVAGVAADWLFPWPFVPTPIPRALVGGGVLGSSFALAVWAVMTLRRAGTRVEPYKPTTAIVADGPYRFTRNPIYIGMLIGQAGVAVGLDDLWVLATLIPFYLVIRYGVIAREEAYLERKFGAVYLSYKSRTRRWL